MDGATMMPGPASSPCMRRYPMTRCPVQPEHHRPHSAAHLWPAEWRRWDNRAPGGSASANRGCSTISRHPARRPAQQRPRRATPATPGPATSTANEPPAARAGPPRADGAASGSRRPSTTPPAATGFRHPQVRDARQRWWRCGVGRGDAHRAAAASARSARTARRLAVDSERAVARAWSPRPIDILVRISL